MAVLQFWTFAPWRVPRTFTTATTAIIASETSFAASGLKATNCWA
jgi:hypothetical protein